MDGETANAYPPGPGFPELEAGRLRFRYTAGSGPQQMLTEADVVHAPLASPDDAQYVIDRVPGAAGFFGASST